LIARRRPLSLKINLFGWFVLPIGNSLINDVQLIDSLRGIKTRDYRSRRETIAFRGFKTRDYRSRRETIAFRGIKTRKYRSSKTIALRLRLRKKRWTLNKRTPQGPGSLTVCDFPSV
jgi:hypothetical protein